MGKQHQWTGINFPTSKSCAKSNIISLIQWVETSNQIENVGICKIRFQSKPSRSPSFIAKEHLAGMLQLIYVYY